MDDRVRRHHGLTVSEFDRFVDAQRDESDWELVDGEVVMMTLLGGTTTLFGPVVGAGLVLLLQDRLTTSNLPVGIVTGLVFILVVLFFRRGVVGTVQHWTRKK